MRVGVRPALGTLYGKVASAGLTPTSTLPSVSTGRFSMSNPNRNLRCWFQFSLRGLLITVTLCAIACSWLGVRLRHAKQQREAAAEIEKLGGKISWSEPSGTEWERSLLGDDFFQDVEFVDLQHTRVTDEDLVCLKPMRHLKCVNLCWTTITDDGLQHLNGLEQLEYLYLSWTCVTDAGLERLKGIRKLRVLHIDSLTEVTGAGLENLKQLNHLQELSLSGTLVEDADVEKLQKALPNCKIWRDSN